MNDDKETYNQLYNLLDRLLEINNLSIQVAQHVKDYSDAEVGTVITGILDCLGHDYGRDSIHILDIVSEVFPMIYEQLMESEEGGD